MSMPSPLQRPHRLAATIVCAGLALALLAGCGRQGDRRARDAQERRIVSVSKQINEFIFAIGAQHDLVAVDLTSVYPPEIRKLPTVGYHRALSAEGIISMKPTVFLTDGNVGPDAVLDQLKKVGIPITVMHPGSTVDSAQALLTHLGEFFHREQAADSVLAEWKAGMDQLWADTATWSGEKRPRVLIIHFGQIINNYLAVKSGSTADQLVRWAGGTNAIDSVGGMLRLTPELIARAAPDVIIATDVGFDRFGSAEKFATLPGVSLTPAGRNKRIYRIDEQKIMYYGPRTPAAVRELHAMLFP
ncbi:MAG TPA: ABC transporter substrate-binding protein [Gemmatimonadaceae bacterium]|nr:ABC transporter substrate-binding protein [Gemmatimonadaceae bacterium]